MDLFIFVIDGVAYKIQKKSDKFWLLRWIHHCKKFVYESEITYNDVSKYKKYKLDKKFYPMYEENID